MPALPIHDHRSVLQTTLPNNRILADSIPHCKCHRSGMVCWPCFRTDSFGCDTMASPHLAYHIKYRYHCFVFIMLHIVGVCSSAVIDNASRIKTCLNQIIITWVLLPGKCGNVDRLIAEHQITQATDKSLAKCGCPNGRRQRDIAISWPSATQIDGSAQFKLRRVAGRTEIIPLSIDGHFTFSPLATQCQIMPSAIIHTASRGTYFGRTWSKVNMNVDMAIQ